MSSFLTALSNGQRLGWSDEIIVIGFLIALTALICFFLWELVTSNPLLQVRLFTNANFAIASICGFIFGMGMFSSVYIMPLFVRTVQHFTATKAGLLLMPSGLVLMLVFPFAGRLAQHFVRGPVIVGLLMFGISFTLLADADANTAFWTLVGLAIVGRVGLGMIMPTLNLHSLRALPQDLLPYAPGTLNFVRMVGGSAGVNIVAVLLNRQTDFYRETLKVSQTADNVMTAEYFRRFTEYMSSQGFEGLDRTAATMGYLRQIIEGQAEVFAFQDGFLFIGVVFLCGILPTIFLNGGPRNLYASIRQGLLPVTKRLAPALRGT